jgi:predicted ATPase
MNGAKLIVISGGPGAGKTALLFELRRRGYSCSSEVARQLIQDQVCRGGDALPWADRERYARFMLERSVAAWREHSQTGGTVFFDRGIPDTLCYALLAGLSPELEKDAKAMCREHRYWRRVFLAPAWREIYQTDAERRQDFEEADRTCDLMVKTYQDCGYEAVILPFVSIAERADFVLAKIAEV